MTYIRRNDFVFFYVLNYAIDYNIYYSLCSFFNYILNDCCTLLIMWSSRECNIIINNWTTIFCIV